MCNGNTCSGCEPGGYLNGGSCHGTSCTTHKMTSFSTVPCVLTVCPVNTYSAGGTAQCTACASGSYAPAGSTSASDCSCNIDRDVRSLHALCCSVWRMWQRLCFWLLFNQHLLVLRCWLLSQPRRLPRSDFSSMLLPHCLCSVCPSGSYSAASSAYCTSCPSGQVSPAGSTSSTDCVAGVFLFVLFPLHHLMPSTCSVDQHDHFGVPHAERALWQHLANKPHPLRRRLRKRCCECAGHLGWPRVRHRGLLHWLNSHSFLRHFRGHVRSVSAWLRACAFGCDQIAAWFLFRQQLLAHRRQRAASGSDQQPRFPTLHGHRHQQRSAEPDRQLEGHHGNQVP